MFLKEAARSNRGGSFSFTSSSLPQGSQYLSSSIRKQVLPNVPPHLLHTKQSYCGRGGGQINLSEIIKGEAVFEYLVENI